MTRSWATPPDPRLPATNERTAPVKLTVRRSAVTALTTGLALMAVSGGSYAFWSTTGSGSGTAAAGTSQMLTVGTGGVSGLYPTGPAVAGTVAVTNTNDFAIVITAASFGATSVSGNTAACTASTVSFTVGTLPTTKVVKGASVNIPFAAQMSNDAENGCQSPATFSAALSVTAQSTTVG